MSDGAASTICIETQSKLICPKIRLLVPRLVVSLPLDMLTLKSNYCHAQLLFSLLVFDTVEFSNKQYLRGFAWGREIACHRLISPLSILYSVLLIDQHFTEYSVICTNYSLLGIQYTWEFINVFTILYSVFIIHHSAFCTQYYSYLNTVLCILYSELCTQYSW